MNLGTRFLLLSVSLLTAFLLAALNPAGTPAVLMAQSADWRLLRPSNSGIPGEEIRFVRHAPDGNLWVGARWPFWQEGGIGILEHDSQVWGTLVNFETPIPSEYVNDLEFGQDGTAWIATDLGLVRYDGQDYTVYDPTNSPMQLYKVRDIAVAPDGHIWINNSDFNAGGDAIFDFDGNTTWKKYKVPDQLPWTAPWEDLSEVFVDSKGHAWVANDTLSGVAEYDGTRWVLRGENLGKLDEMAEDQFGNIWINAHGVGGDYAFFRWDGAAFTKYPLSSPTTLTADPDTGTIYVGSWHGTVLRTKDGGATIETYLTGLNKVFSIAPDPAGTDVWIGTIGAVGHFQDDGTLVHDYNTYNTGMPWFWVDYMSLDREGYFWVATGEAGLSRFDGQRWRNWGAHNAGSEAYPFAGNEPMGGAYQDQDGVYWFGGNGIARWDSNTGQFTGFWNWQNNPGMGATLFPFFAEDGSGKLFAATEYGTTYHFDENQQLWIKEPVQPYAVTGLPGMEADSQGNVWIAAWFDIHKWDGISWSKVALPHPNYFFDLGGISGLALGPDDVMWLGTGGGLVRWDGAAFTLFDMNNSPVPAGYVTGVDVRPDGVIGLAAADDSSASGAAVISGDPSNPSNWEVHLYGQSPLPHWQLGRVAFDAEGNLWIAASSMGVAVLMHPSQALKTDPHSLAAHSGGEVDFSLEAGPSNAGRNYLLLGSMSGTAPGIPLPGGAATLPLAWDPFTDLVLALVNTPVFIDFMGVLNASGEGTARLDTLGPLPYGIVGTTLYFAYALNPPWDFASNAVFIEITP